MNFYFLKRARKAIYTVLEGKASMLYEIVSYGISTCIAISILCLVLSTFAELSAYHSLFFIIEMICIIIFSIEFLLRLWVYPLKKEYKGMLHTLSSTILLFDALLIVPFWISFLLPESIAPFLLASLRVFRMFRIRNHFPAFKQLLSIIYQHKKDLISVYFLMFIISFFLSICMYYVENEIQSEKFSNILQSFYWAVITMATVGFGDITPITIGGKIITTMLIMFGAWVYTMPAAIIGSAFYAEIRSKQEKEIVALKEKITELLAIEKKYNELQKK